MGPRAGGAPSLGLSQRGGPALLAECLELQERRSPRARLTLPPMPLADTLPQRPGQWSERAFLSRGSAAMVSNLHWGEAFEVRRVGGGEGPALAPPGQWVCEAAGSLSQHPSLNSRAWG